MVNLTASQKGYALLMMLAILSAGSVAVLRPLLNGAASPDAGSALMARQPVMSARQALLVYAALYPTLYGPRGAGPGHLPCPDTKGAEGPDPPCGRHTRAEGRLPRHVTLPSSRYAFNEQTTVDMEYAVSSRLINNPVNRIVNDQWLGQSGGSPAYLARLFVEQYAQAGFPDRTLAAISGQALLPGLKASVVGWLHTRIRDASSMICFESDSSVRDSGGQGMATADQTAVNNILRQVADSLPPGVQAACDGNAEAFDLEQVIRIEGVPASDHWFVRNRWHERLEISDQEVLFR